MPEETYSTDGPICPHCGDKFTPDAPGYYDESGFEITCSCGETFDCQPYTSTSWTCKPRD